MVLDQGLRQGDDILGLVTIKANGFDVVADHVLAERQHFFRRVGDSEQRHRCPVDAFVCCLGGQDNGDQKGKRVDRMKFALWLRLDLLETAEDLNDFIAFEFTAPGHQVSFCWQR